jgi:hypothetical protein
MSDPSSSEEKPAPVPFVCPYHKPSPPWTWRESVALLALVAASIVASFGVFHVMKWSERYWIMSSYLAKPITLYSYRGHREWVDRERIEKSIEQKEREAYGDGFRDGKGLCEAKYKGTKLLTPLCVSTACADACAAIRKAGAHDMEAQTPGHACDFFCEGDMERGDDPWPLACFQRAKSQQDVHDCWIGAEKKP